MKRILFYVLSLLSVANSMLADDTVTGTFVGPSTENEWTLDVNLANETSFIAFQMNVTLPSDVTILSVTPVDTRLAKGDDITVSGQTVETPFVVSCDAVASRKNCYRITGYNRGNNPIVGTKGYPIVKLLLQADGEKKASEMGASFTDVDFINVSLSDNDLDDAKGTTGLLDQYLKITALEDGTTKLAKKGSPSATVQYATATTGWQDYDFGTDISLTEGNSTWFRAKGTNGKNEYFCESDETGYTFSSSNSIAASQNIMSLLDASCTQTSVPACAFAYLFQNCTGLTTAPDLPATKLSFYSYGYMFDGCKNLNYVSVGFTDWSTSNSTTPKWLNNVSETGTFVCPTALTIPECGVSTVPEGWTIQNLTVTLNSKGYATFSNSFDVQVASGCKAYTVLFSGDNIVCTRITDDVIPAYNGVLLYGEPDATVRMKVAKDAPALQDNELKPTTTSSGIASLVDSYTLSGDTFKHFAGTSYNAGRAYIPTTAYTGSNAGAKAFTIVWIDEEATGVSEMKDEESGMMSDGKYIKNGSLIIVKGGKQYNANGVEIK